MQQSRRPVAHDLPVADDLYDQDFFAWTQKTAALVRARRFDQLDVNYLAEEIEDLGRRDRREVSSRLTVLMTHLLKWQLQPEQRQRSKSWIATIDTQRRELEGIFEQSPSLKPYAAEYMEKAYLRAVKSFRLETGLDRPLPATPPFTLEQILDNDFLPG
ncbi:MAG: DUF29 domain-containing protein [Acidobacteria bacterium]|nr:DUF29 domain-containing protein [Acidobacteriota bacterium]